MGGVEGESHSDISAARAIEMPTGEKLSRHLITGKRAVREHAEAHPLPLAGP